MQARHSSKRARRLTKFRPITLAGWSAGCGAIRHIEGDIDLFDAANAEEMFLTSTSLCIAGVRSFNVAKIGDGGASGSITKRLTDAYIAEVGCDFVKQYLDRLS